MLDVGSWMLDVGSQFSGVLPQLVKQLSALVLVLVQIRAGGLGQAGEEEPVSGVLFNTVSTVWCKDAVISAHSG